MAVEKFSKKLQNDFCKKHNMPKEKYASNTFFHFRLAKEHVYKIYLTASKN